MQRMSIVSSNIASIGYDATEQILEVEFKTGAVYAYSSLPREVYEGLINSVSHGKYFAARIKNVYVSSRIR